MQYVIVGALLLIIISCAGWLIFFYTKLTNSKAKVEDKWVQVNSQLQKRADLIRQLCSEPASSAEFIDITRRLREIDEKIELHRHIFNDAVRMYNVFIKSFPHNIAAAIMGVNNLSYLQSDEVAEILCCSQIKTELGDIPGNQKRGDTFVDKTKN